MNQKNKNVWRKFVQWYKQDPDEKQEEEEFDEFLSKVEKRMNRIKSAQRAETHQARAEVALMFENAYTQRKMVEANNSLKAATWVLAVATIAFTIGTVYGIMELNKMIQVALQIFIGIIVIGLALFVLKGIWNFIKFIYKIFKKKK